MHPAKICRGKHCSGLVTLMPAKKKQAKSQATGSNCFKTFPPCDTTSKPYLRPTESLSHSIEYQVDGIHWWAIFNQLLMSGVSLWTRNWLDAR